MNRVYIAGPMRGYPEHNYPAFRATAARLRALGHEVVSPAEIGDTVGGQDCGWSAQQFVALDLFHLLSCDAVALLNGWERSTGARCEAAVAVTLGLRFFDANGFGIEAPHRVIVSGGYEKEPGHVDTLDSLAVEASAWANSTFTSATQSSRAEHLRREVEELCAAPDDLEEMADVFMLLGHLAQGRDLVGAVRDKLEKNKRRVWGKPDADGVVEHIEVEA